MFGAIVILLVLPYTDLGRSRGFQFRPISKFAFYLFSVIFITLGRLGAVHVEDPFILMGQVYAVMYFGYFTVILPAVSTLENSFTDIAYSDNKPTKSK
jgi:ubiquinol-cytochrome c reductase cytochrome b subunit